ncbi:hypothetical protein K491DRAFT_674320 [Lophiostoma macrostomum CBS 122681]|uniref:Gfd2/YDR514C-like C-terminal domain-containing protein n=1 Tax=Lophiostoma macrostomum CBS 122681 TaxID=1314788 RepID=A0A6A6TNG7_9PLEO|nr:hypothetical protein K491DRAFT_674320 [Lophiostoma macrostomum CBS 122681]
MAPSPFSELRSYLAKKDVLAILRHFLGQPLPDAPDLLDKAVFVGLDLEWWEYPPHSPKAPITEVGLAIFKGSDLVNLAAPPEANFLEILECIKIHHLRILETCHFRNTKLAAQAEHHFLFGETRFLEEQATKELLISFLCAQGIVSPEDETTTPIILFAFQAGVRAEDKGTLQDLLNGFGVERVGKKSDIQGKSMIEIVAEFIKMSQAQEPPSWGIPHFCFRCESTEHDYSSTSCKVPIQKCELCLSVTGPENSKLRKKANNHTYERCAVRIDYHRITTIPLPRFIKESKALNNREKEWFKIAVLQRDQATIADMMMKVFNNLEPFEMVEQGGLEDIPNELEVRENNLGGIQVLPVHAACPATLAWLQEFDSNDTK